MKLGYKSIVLIEGNIQTDRKDKIDVIVQKVQRYIDLT